MTPYSILMTTSEVPFLFLSVSTIMFIPLLSSLRNLCPYFSLKPHPHLTDTVAVFIPPLSGTFRLSLFIEVFQHNLCISPSPWEKILVSRANSKIVLSCLYWHSSWIRNSKIYSSPMLKLIKKGREPLKLSLKWSKESFIKLKCIFQEN